MLKHCVEVIAAAVSHETSVGVERTYRPHDESVWFLPKVCMSVLREAREMLEMINPHASASIAGVYGHGYIVNEEKIVP